MSHLINQPAFYFNTNDTELTPIMVVNPDQYIAFNNATKLYVDAKVVELKNGVATDGDTLLKLRDLIFNLNVMMSSTDTSLNTFQKLVTELRDLQSTFATFPLDCISPLELNMILTGYQPTGNYLTSITNTNVVNALGFLPISGITNQMVTNLGFTTTDNLFTTFLPLSSGATIMSKIGELEFIDNYIRSELTDISLEVTGLQGVNLHQSTLISGLTLNTIDLNGDINDIYVNLNKIDNLKLDLSGDTMTGNLALIGNPTLVNHASNKGYVDVSITNSNLTSKQYTDTAIINSNSIYNGGITRFNGEIVKIETGTLTTTFQRVNGLISSVNKGGTIITYQRDGNNKITGWVVT